MSYFDELNTYTRMKIMAIARDQNYKYLPLFQECNVSKEQVDSYDYYNYHYNSDYDSDSDYSEDDDDDPDFEVSHYSFTGCKKDDFDRIDAEAMEKIKKLEKKHIKNLKI